MSTSNAQQQSFQYQYLNGRLNLAQLKEHSKSSFLELISAQSPGGKKALVWDKQLLSTFSLLVEYSSLKERGVDHLFHLEEDFVIAADISSYLFVCRTNYEVIQLVGKIAQSCKAAIISGNVSFSLIFVPLKSFICERILQDMGVYQCFKKVESYHLDLIAIDSDVLSLEYNVDFYESYAEELGTVSYQALYGPIPHVYSKGKWAGHVHECLQRMLRMCDVSFTSQPPQIDSVVLIDRTVDNITPLITPLTYEALIDELFGITYSVAQLPADRFPDDSNKGPIKKVQLNSSEELFVDLRDLHFASVGGYLSRRAKNLNVVMDERHMAQSVSQLRLFVAKIPHIQVTKKNLALHTTIAEIIKEVVDEPEFGAQKAQEQSLLEEVECDKISDYIDKLIGRNENIIKILKLICLQSQVNSGLKPKVYEYYKREIIHGYGLQHIVTLQRLEHTGLIKIQSTSNKVYNHVKRYFKLTRDIDVKNPEDIAYTHSGYAPLSVRIIENLIIKQASHTPTWKKLDDSIFRLLSGPSSESTSIQHTIPRETSIQTTGQKLVLVYYIGGVTYGEISALRYLSQLEDSTVNFIVATTKITNGNKLIDSLVYKTIKQ